MFEFFVNYTPFLFLDFALIIIIINSIKKQKNKKKISELVKNNEFISKNSEKVSEIFDKKYSKPKKNRIWYAVVFLVVCLVFSIIINNRSFANVLVFISMFLLALAIWSYNNDSDEKFIEITKDVLHDFDPDIEYNSSMGFSANEYALCRFPETCDLFRSEDMIINLKKGFYYADILVESEHEDSDGNTYYSTEYQGSLAKMYIKNIGCKIYLGGMKIDWFFKSDDYVNIKFENDEFNKLFMAYSDDELQAYKILTPDVMEEFVKIKKYSFGDVDIRILDNILYIRFLSGNGFDSSSFSKEKDKDNLCQTIAIIEEVMKTMDKVKTIIEKKNIN